MTEPLTASARRRALLRRAGSPASERRCAPLGSPRTRSASAPAASPGGRTAPRLTSASALRPLRARPSSSAPAAVGSMPRLLRFGNLVLRLSSRSLRRLLTADAGTHRGTSSRKAAVRNAGSRKEGSGQHCMVNKSSMRELESTIVDEVCAVLQRQPYRSRVTTHSRFPYVAAEATQSGRKLDIKFLLK